MERISEFVLGFALIYALSSLSFIPMHTYGLSFHLRCCNGIQLVYLGVFP